MKKSTRMIFIVMLIIISGVVFVTKENIHLPQVGHIPISKATSTDTPHSSSTTPEATSTKPVVYPYGKASVHVGGTIMFPLSSLKLIRVFEDSRCPSEVTCIWAGTVKAEVLYTNFGGGAITKIIELNTTESVEKGSIRMVSVIPSPQQGTPILQKDYVVTMG